VAHDKRLTRGDLAVDIIAESQRVVDMSQRVDLEPDDRPFFALVRKVWPTMSDEEKWFFVRLLLGDVSPEELSEHWDSPSPDLD